MDIKEYEKLALKVDRKDDYEFPMKQMNDSMVIQLDHSIRGCVDEAGELNKAMKSYVYYGKPFDIVNLIEEYGDLLWYINKGLTTIGSSIEEAMDVNIAKLNKRYPNLSYSAEKANNRDTNEERKVLENHCKINEQLKDTKK